MAAERGVVAADATEIEARDDGEGDDGDGGEAKYARRPRSVRRSLQRAFPALFPASLPVTARWNAHFQRAPCQGSRETAYAHWFAEEIITNCVYMRYFARCSPQVGAYLSPHILVKILTSRNWARRCYQQYGGGGGVQQQRGCSRWAVAHSSPNPKKV